MRGMLTSDSWTLVSIGHGSCKFFHLDTTGDRRENGAVQTGPAPSSLIAQKEPKSPRPKGKDHLAGNVAQVNL